MPGFFLAYVLRHMLLLHPLVLQIRLLRVVLLFLWLTLGIPAVRAFHIITPAPCVILHVTTNMPRCCHPIADEFKPSYASVLVYGPDAPAKLEDAVRDAESRQRITSCFTAWCSSCQRPYLLTTDLAGFPCPSAHHTHQLLLLSVLRESGAFFPMEPV
jgi:hypothetical protein